MNTNNFSFPLRAAWFPSTIRDPNLKGRQNRGHNTEEASTRQRDQSRTIRISRRLFALRPPSDFSHRSRVFRFKPEQVESFTPMRIPVAESTQVRWQDRLPRMAVVSLVGIPRLQARIEALGFDIPRKDGTGRGVVSWE
jgi:hypothetical protein